MAKPTKTLYGVSAISKKDLLAGAKQTAEAQREAEAQQEAEAQREAEIQQALEAAILGAGAPALRASIPAPRASITDQFQLRVEDLEPSATGADAAWDELERQPVSLAVATEESAGHVAPVPAVQAVEPELPRKIVLTKEDMVATTLPMDTLDEDSSNTARDTIPSVGASVKAAPVSTLSAIDLDDDDDVRYPAPVAPSVDTKAAEKAFFGVTLSRYGMVPAQKLPEMTPEMKRARRRAYIMLTFGIVVLGAILGAIGFMMSMGE